MNSMIKKFSFLLSLKTWFEPIVFPGSLAVLIGQTVRQFNHVITETKNQKQF